MELGIAGRRALVCASSKGLGKGCALALAACNTVRGVGQDLESVANTSEEAIN